MSNPTTFTYANQTVNRLGYGAMRITGPGIWDYPADREECVAVLRRAVELGVNFIDTADSALPTARFRRTDRLALHPYGEVKIATKAGLLRTGPDVWVPCGRPDYLRQECEMSLRRLGQESIDLFQLHRIDPTVPRDEQFGLLKTLLDEGKVQALGLSEVSVEEVKAAQQVFPVATVQNLYNATNRQSEENTRLLRRRPGHWLHPRGFRSPLGTLPAVADHCINWRPHKGSASCSYRSPGCFVGRPLSYRFRGRRRWHLRLEKNLSSVRCDDRRRDVRRSREVGRFRYKTAIAPGKRLPSETLDVYQGDGGSILMYDTITYHVVVSFSRNKVTATSATPQ